MRSLKVIAPSRGVRRVFVDITFDTGTADSALAAADLLHCFNQGRIIFIAPGGQKMFLRFAS